jgi:hypothetical protein
VNLQTSEQKEELEFESIMAVHGREIRALADE